MSVHGRSVGTLSQPKFGLTLFAGPSTEPVSLTEAKEQLRVDDNNSDAYIALLISAAREWAESYTRRSFIDQTWDLFFDHFPLDDACILVPVGGFKSVTTLKYNQEVDGNQITWPSSNYIVDGNRPVGRIALAFDQIWPETRLQINAVEVRLVAGYGTSVDNVPGEIKHSIKILVAHFFENRELTVVGTIVSKIPLSVERALRHYKVW